MKVIVSLRHVVLTAGILSLLIGGVACNRADQTTASAPTEDSVSTEDRTPADTETAPIESESASEDATPDTPAQETPPSAQPEPAPPASTVSDAPEPSVQASQPTSTADASLPETLVKTWEPLSEVLYSFGPMTITPTEIRWDEGQTSSYEVVSVAEGSYLLKLSAVPSFYDTPNPYLKLTPEAGSQEVEVYFYETETDANQDAYIMLGTYFAE